jgi:hypothetical protein
MRASRRTSLHLPIWRIRTHRSFCSSVDRAPAFRKEDKLTGISPFIAISLASLSPRLRKAQISKVIDQLIVMSSGGASKGEELRDVASLGRSAFSCPPI